MGIIGIVANPDSGKDIRRLVSHATVYDNNEKTNIVERIILTIQQFGDHEIYLMPDRYNFAMRLLKKSTFKLEGRKDDLFKVLEMKTTDSADDTTAFVRRMNEMGASAVIVLGGDGTSRAAAKAIGQVPMIPVSTGTNNVFPEMGEGTIIGMAAAALASKYVDKCWCCTPSKRIEIYKNGQFADIALVDAVITSHVFTGSKAVWDVDEIKEIFVTKSHPASIGFSALIGSSMIINDDDRFGARASVTKENPNRLVPFAAAVIEAVGIENVEKIAENKEITMQMNFSGMIALDGEREVNFKSGDTLTFYIKRNGPWKVNLRRVLEEALKKGMYEYRADNI